MLDSIHIANFALIHDIELSFEPGLNVLTGETGAGKSIIIEALGLLLGQRADRASIRSGASCALITGQFSVNDAIAEYLTAWEFAADEPLVIVRELHRSGRSKCRINGRLVSVSQLAQLAPALVHILGQQDQLQLMQQDQHLVLLDAAGDHQHRQLEETVRQLYREYRQIESRLQQSNHSEQERQQKLDFLRFQIDDIAAAELQPDEDEALLAEQKRLAAVEQLQNETTAIYQQLQEPAGDHVSVCDQLSAISRSLNELQQIDPALADIAEAITDAQIKLDDSSRSLRYHSETYSADPERLHQVEERLHLIQDLKRKYGPSTEAILAHLEACRSEWTELESMEQRQEQLLAQQRQLKQQWKKAAADLTAHRRVLAADLETALQQELSDLNMDKAAFKAAFGSKRSAVHPQGDIPMEFLFSANPGEEPGPLARIASGGELSRVMLAFQSVLAGIDHTPTLVFDEIDTGIGGKTAQKLAEKLSTLSRQHQVLSITHLPVIAAYGDHHIAVTKQEHSSGTEIQAAALSATQRLEELIRMLGGEADHPGAVKHAQELLQSRCSNPK